MAQSMPDTLSVTRVGWKKASFLSGSMLCSCLLLRKSGPVVLFFDGHGSHIGIDIVTKARKENVILYCLPPHTTHVLQPLAVSEFVAVKRAWGKILKDFKTTVCNAVVTKQVFPSLLSRLWDESMHPEHLVSGFRATGLHPLNRDAITNDKLQTAVPFQAEQQPPKPLEVTPIAKEVTRIFTDHQNKKQAKKE